MKVCVQPVGLYPWDVVTLPGDSTVFTGNALLQPWYDGSAQGEAAGSTVASFVST